MAEFPDALIEQAAQAVADAHNRYVQRNPAPAYMQFDAEVARAVLEAVAPAIAAQALRDAARGFDIYADLAIDVALGGSPAAADWLRERADQIEKEGTDA